MQDLKGKQFGRLKVIKFLFYGANRHDSVWLCLCRCGATAQVGGGNLNTGHTKSCGCLATEKATRRIQAVSGRCRTVNLKGKQYGRLTVVKSAGYTPIKPHRALWVCRCSCGIEITVLAQSLRSGHTKSCGCFHRDDRTHGINHKIKHGHRRVSATTREYRSWRCMIQRCTDLNHTSYPRYGAVGVRICDRWNTKAGGSFENFLADIGPRPKGATLGRTLDMGNYEPGNVFWMTKAEQTLAAMNKRHLLKWAAEREGEWKPETMAA